MRTQARKQYPPQPHPNLGNLFVACGRWQVYLGGPKEGLLDLGLWTDLA